MNKYLALYHHFMGPSHGVMTIVIKASSQSAALEYLDKQFKYPENWKLEKIQLIGIPTHA